MQRREFERQLRDLLRAPVDGVDAVEKSQIVGRHLAFIEEHQRLNRFGLAFEPFVAGRRPDDELAYPGLGSSEQVGLYHPDRDPGDRVCLLVRCFDDGQLIEAPPEGASVLVTIDRTTPSLGRQVVRGWSRRDVTDATCPQSAPEVTATGPARAMRLDLDVNDVVDLVLADAGEGVLGFESMFHAELAVAMDVELGGTRIAGDEISVDVYAERAFGSLYQRVIDVLLPFDTRRQVGLRGLSLELPVASHPWFPVLCIGTQKGRLYMDSIAADLVEQKRALTDPVWLLRVGLYLEFLTALGIAEAARDEIDILTPHEREVFENDERFAEVRRRLDVDAWRQVWKNRSIALSRSGSPTMTNLLRKKAATFEFLHAHHEDLKQAIALAGPNLHNAQETWHRVFRDAERAVIQTNDDAFPEMRELPTAVRSFILWHQRGRLGSTKLVPRRVADRFGDQDGVFPSACRQYRESMNEVAAWASERGLMTYTGDECIPSSASLLEAKMANRPSLLARLQLRDGFAGTLEIRKEDHDGLVVDSAAVAERLGDIPTLGALTIDELQDLARSARPIVLGHLERILIQGRSGSSLFVLYDGSLEVVTHDGSRSEQIALLNPLSVIGERGFLLDEPRTATVRAIEHAVVLEIGAARLRPLVEARPALIDALAALLDERRPTDSAPIQGRIRERVRRAIFGSSGGSQAL